MVRSHRVCVAMHVPVAQIFTTDRRFLLQNYGNPQPIDYMGEQELSAGRYTYSLGVDNGRLSVQLEKVN